MSALKHTRRRFDTEISEVEYLSPTVRQFSIAVPSNFTFSPGQYVTLKLDIGDRKVSRAYSIASHDLKCGLQLCVKIVEGGLLSPHLFESVSGTKVSVVGPIGNFIVPNNLLQEDICFVATGTGVAPFRAIINDLLNSSSYKGSISLVFGVRYEKELLYLQEWRKLVAKYKERFNFFPCVTRFNPKESKLLPNVESLPNILNQEIFLGRVNNLLENHMYYFQSNHFFICGLGEMVDTVSILFEKNSVSKNNIHLEKYD